MTQSVLLLGAGYVTKPVLETLSKSNVNVIVACRTLETAEKLCLNIPTAKPMTLDVENSTALDEHVAKVDLVISLVPFVYHALVIKSAIRCKKNVVTTSYVNPSMRELDQEAQDAGITILNEIGLDPGLDHLFTLHMINQVHRQGGKVKTLSSFCGGLPAPEHSDNPLGYKFSWSPRGVLLALQRDAKVRENGTERFIKADVLMQEAKPYTDFPGFNLVAYPNGDSTPYPLRYGVPECENLTRGTFRYACFVPFVKALRAVGLLNDKPDSFFTPTDSPPTWAQAMTHLLQAKAPTSADEIWQAAQEFGNFSQHFTPEEVGQIRKGMEWLELFSTGRKIDPRGTSIDTLCELLKNKMNFEKHERDLVLMHIKLNCEYDDGHNEIRSCTLATYGDPDGYSAMAKLVGIPCAIACKKILNGSINKKGVIAPLEPDLVEAILSDLPEYGISPVYKTVKF